MISSKQCVLIFFVLLLNSIQVLADNRETSVTYSGNVAASFTAAPDIGLTGELTTSHGCDFGNGVFVGGSIGTCASVRRDGVYLPIALVARYSFNQNSHSFRPFLECRTGYLTSFEHTYTLSEISLGIRVSHYSLFVTYKRYGQNDAIYYGVSWNF